MNNSSQYIESVSLEILDRPRLWLEKDDSHKFNIETFNTRKATLAFLQQYKGWTLLKAQKIVLAYNNEQLHLVVRHFKYENINKDLTINPNTTVEFIYRRILFCQIKWPKVIINNRKQSQSMNKNQSRTTQEVLNETSKILTSLLPMIDDSQNREYQSNNHLQGIMTDEDLTLEHTIEEDNHFRSTIFLHVSPIGMNHS